MSNCIFCAAILNNTTKPEHILLQSLGGRKTSKSTVCSECNNFFGTGIDEELANSVRSLRNIAGFRSGNRRQAPSIAYDAEDGASFELGPGGVPKIRLDEKIKINKTEDGKTEIAIAASSEQELNYLLENIANKYRITGENKKKLIREMKEEAILHSTPAPTLQFKLELGSRDAQRSMAKACFTLWADVVGSEEARKAEYEDVRRFIRFADDGSSAEPLITIDTSELPSLDAKFGTNPNIVWVGSDDRGRVLGYFRLYGAVGWRIALSKGSCVSNKTHCLVSNPEDPATWQEFSNAGSPLNFGWVSSLSGEPNFVAVRERLGKLLQGAHSRSRENLVAEIVDKAIRNCGLREGDIFTREALNQIASEIAKKATYTQLRLPYSEPFIKNKRPK